MRLQCFNLKASRILSSRIRIYREEAVIPGSVSTKLLYSLAILKQHKHTRIYKYTFNSHGQLAPRLYI